MKPFRMKEHTPTEHQEQAGLFAWARLRRAALPELDMLAAVPNGGARNRVTGAMLKAEGVSSGFPDMFLFCPRGGFHGLAIELKRVNGGTVSPQQTDWLARLAAQGYKATVAFGAAEAIEIIEAYLAADHE